MTENPTKKWIKRHSVSLRLATRIIIASVLTFILCRALALEQSQWAILTAITVMQSSVGASLKATLDRFAGSIGGAFWGICILVALPRDDEMATGLALAVTLIPLAALAAFRPAYRVAPITGVILLLTPMGPDRAPWVVGLDRVIEVGLGSVVALIVALLIFPVRAHDTLATAASNALRMLADLMDELSKALVGQHDRRIISNLHYDIRRAVTRAETIADEAARERTSYLVLAPDPQPICRTLRRLRHDLTMIGRILGTPLTSPLVGARELTELTQTAQRSAETIADYLRNCAVALTSRKLPPPIGAVEHGLAAYAAALAQARRAGAIGDLADEEVACVFGLAFGFVQLSENLEDLSSRAEEFAGVQNRRRRYLKSHLLP